MAIIHLTKSDFKIAIISSGFKGDAVQRRAEMLGIQYCSVNREPKIDRLNTICKELDLKLENVAMIGDDIKLAKLLFSLAQKEPELEAVTHGLSITTLRYVPTAFADDNEYLNKLNEDLLNNLQNDGEVFLSNAIVQEKYCLRACIVNFRTSKQDIEEVIQIIIREGTKVHQTLSE